MQNLINESPGKKNYDFIDAIRAIAMISIVMEHAFSVNDMLYHPADKLSIVTYAVVIQFIKFGTISFFLISGFLIGEKLSDSPGFQFLKKRADNTLLPWLFWSLFFCGMMVLNDVVSAYQFNHGQFPPQYGFVVLNYLRIIYLYTIYWFIPNFLICIAVLLVFKRYIYSCWLGAMFLLFTIIYIFNIYNEWIEPRHSTAILGFVVFLWLGVQFNKHLKAVEKWLHKTSIFLWIGLCIVFLVLGVNEILLLKKLHSVDSFNSLRPSNILYSMCFFFLLFKIEKFKFIKYLKPRETTYGIYLIHYIIVYCGLPVIFPMFRLSITQLTFGEFWLYMLVRFIITYVLTFIIVTLLNKSKAKWLVGR